MVDQRPRRLRFAREGHRLVVVGEEALRIVSVPGMETVCTIAVAQLRDYALFGDQLWVVAGEPATLSVYTVDGEALIESAALPDGGAGQLEAIPFGAPAALWSAGDVHRVEVQGDGISVRRVFGPADVVIPVEPTSFAVARGERLTLVRGEQEEWTSSLDEASGGRVLAGSALFEGRSIAVVLESGAGDDRPQSLHVVGSREGQPLHRLGLRQITSARFAPRRGYALLCGGHRKLLVVDLRFGKVLKDFRESRDVIGAAIDPAARHIALVLKTADGRELPVYTPYREFMNAEAGGDLDEADSTVASEEAPGERDSRSRLEALAAARRARDSDDEELEQDDGAIDIPELAGLLPRGDATPCTRDEALRLLDLHVALLAGLSEAVIARGWDTGRIAFPDDGVFPFEKEVAGILGRPLAAGADRVGTADGEASAAAAELVRARAALGGRSSPLRELMDEFNLSLLAAEILMVIAGPILWSDLARLYAISCNDLEHAGCDEHLIGLMLASDRSARHDIARELDPDRPLLKFGLIRVVDPKKQRPFVPLTVDPLVLRRLRRDPLDSLPGEITRVREADRTIEELAIRRGVIRRAVAQLARAPAHGFARLVVRGRLGAGRRTLLAALCQAANRQLGVIDTSLIGREPAQLTSGLAEALRRCVLRGWVPCIDGLEDDDALDRSTRDQLRELFRAHPGPVTFRTDWDSTPPIDPSYTKIDVPALAESERAAVWQDTIARHQLKVDDIDALAARYRVGPGTITRVAGEVRGRRTNTSSNGHPEGAADADASGIDGALRRHLEVRLGTVATRVHRLANWSNVVLPADLVDSLLELIARIRHRRTVYEQWGFDSSMTSSRGLTALFEGAPGTGKSMVAGVIASELGLDLYRVDLSRVMSKWIGETERNLASVFDAAEEGQAIVLFDEADSLFSKRTEVKSSVDRYANLEVNYLLQRLDTFEGIAVLTSNFGGSIDRAFKRRMSLRLTFPFPDEELRMQLWRVHLPPELPTSGEFDLMSLARKYRLSGGYIRNAALRAAFLAAEDKTPLTQQHLERAIRLEYREMGKLADSGALE